MEKENKYKALYESLKDVNELSRFMPKMTGDWEKDKKKFIVYQEDLEKQLTNQAYANSGFTQAGVYDILQRLFCILQFSL